MDPVVIILLSFIITFIILNSKSEKAKTAPQRNSRRRSNRRRKAAPASFPPNLIVTNIQRHSSTEDEEEHGDDTDDDDDIIMEYSLTEDTFSLLFLSRVGSGAFTYSLFVYCFQMAINILVLTDLMGDVRTLSSSNDNPLRVPPGVNWKVNIAQALAMILAVAVQTNIPRAITKLIQGYDAASANNKTNSSIGATSCKYLLSNILQLITGCLILAISFILNMQSTTVIELMLNFAALGLISEIPTIAFAIARHGFLSHSIQHQAELVQHVFATIPKQERRPFAFLKRIIYLLLTLIILSCYGVIVHQQHSGVFLCQKIFVQFGDEFIPMLSFFSGQYHQSASGNLIAGRVVYVGNQVGEAKFAYCEAEKAWTFSVGRQFDPTTLKDTKDDAQVSDYNDDPCVYYLAKSEPTTSFDITSTMSSPWSIKRFYTNEILPIDWMTLKCVDCELHQCTNGNGVCINNDYCECHPGRYGDLCDKTMPCKELVLDQRRSDSTFTGANHALAKAVINATWELLLVEHEEEERQEDPVFVYDKPVYVSNIAATATTTNSNSSTTEITTTNYVFIMIFLGRRWSIIPAANLIDGMTNIQNQYERDALVKYLQNKFHGMLSSFRPLFLSDVLDVGRFSDDSSPVDKKWYTTRIAFNDYLLDQRAYYKADQLTGTNLICKNCKPFLNDCYNGGICTGRGGKCLCNYGYSGALCEREHLCTDKPNYELCYNHGTCVNETGICICDSQYTGTLCQHVNPLFV